MGLRIQHNIAAMNAHRRLTVSDADLSKSLERLSSGFRINKAADDAAGLAISQSFRADIASFKVASRNASEASSLLQVAEGAMDQIGNMLVRLKELATQAASANVSADNREKINAEGNALIDEIDRIANATKYGGSNLLNGGFGDLTSEWTAIADTTDNSYLYNSANAYQYKYTDTSTDTPTITLSGTPNMAEGTWTMASSSATTVTIGNGSVTESATIDGSTLEFANLGITLTGAEALTGNMFAGDSIVVEDANIASVSVSSSASAGTYTIADSGGTITIGNGTITQGLSASAGNTLNFNSLGITLVLTSEWEAGDINSDTTLVVTNSGSATFQIGAANSAYDRISISIGDSRGTVTTGLSLAKDKLSSASLAQTALTTVDDAIKTLSSRRGDIGASMNRLGYAVANLATTVENVQAAESIIRDVDMANEMTEFTKNQILLQAGTAMLAQANLAPQLVLSLFG